MAYINNPSKLFQFNIIVPGLNPFLCQKVSSPEIEFDISEHGDTNYLVKTAGIKKVGQITLDKLLSAVDIDPFFSTWANLIGDSDLGGGAIPGVYKKDIVIQQLGPDRLTVVKTWLCKGCWPQKRNSVEFDRKSSDNTLEQIQFCVDKVTEL